MSRRPQPMDHAASLTDVPTTSSSSYSDTRPPPADRAVSEPFGGYDVPASSTTPSKPLRSILTNPVPPPSTPRVRFLIPQSSGEIRDRLAGNSGLVDSPESNTSTTSRGHGDSESEEDSPKPARRLGPPEPRDLSDIIGHSVRGFMRRNFQDRERREREQAARGGPISSRGLEDSYRTTDNGSPAQSDASSVTSPQLQRAALANTGRNSPLQRSFGSRSIEPASQRGPPAARSGSDNKLEPPPNPNVDAQSTGPAGATPRQRPRPSRSPIRRRSSGHDSYYGPGEADDYFYGTPAAEQEPGIYYGPPPPKMPTPPPPPAMIPPKYKPGGGSAASFYNDNVDPDAAVPIQEGSQYELTISTAGQGGPYPPQQPQPQPQQQQPGSFFGGPITAEPTTVPGGFPETPVDSTHHSMSSFSTAPSNPSHPPSIGYQQNMQSGYTLAPIPSNNMTGAMSAIDAATAAELAYEQHLSNSQRPPSQPALGNLPPLPPSTAPAYNSPYPPPASAAIAPIVTGAYHSPQASLTGSQIVQSPIIAAPKPQHPSNVVPAIAAAAFAGGVAAAVTHASSHAHSGSVSSATSQSAHYGPSQPVKPSYQPPPPPHTVTSPTTTKPRPPKPAKPSILAGILSNSGKKPSISSPTTSQPGSGVGGKIIGAGLATTGVAIATAMASQSSSTSKPSAVSQVASATVGGLKPALKPSLKPSSSRIDGKTAALVVGTAAVAATAVAAHHNDKQKQKITHKPSTSSTASTDSGRIHGLQGKLNYNRRSNDIRGVKIPSAMNTFDSASSSDFLFDSDDDLSSSSSSGRKKRERKRKEGKGKSRAVEDLSSSHSSLDFGSDDTGRSNRRRKSYSTLAGATAAVAIPGVVSDLNHSEDEGSSPRNRPGAHMRKKSTDSNLAFGNSLGSNSGYTSDSSLYSTGLSPEAGNGFQFWAVRNRSGRRKARRVSSRDSVNSALGWGDSSDEGGKKVRQRDSVDSNLAFGLSSASTSRRSSYATLNSQAISEEDEDEYERKTKRTSQSSTNTAAVAGATVLTAAQLARRRSHEQSLGIIAAGGHRLITEEQRMADYERLDKLRRTELERDIARQKEAARLMELENDRREKERFDRERLDRRRKEEEFARERQRLDEDVRKGGFLRQVIPFRYYF
ncbi:hypothetical protein AA313_de0206371 [Arthrobotrys entomopaga]|nr:hypothetical protein AA313_de0206371 [Arthrobotrys entomopaga]